MGKKSLKRKVTFRAVTHPGSCLTPAADFVVNQLVCSDSRILQEVKPKNGEVITTFEYEAKNKHDLADGFCYLPKWALVMGVLFLTFILLVFITALVVIMGADQPGLYGESCDGRSCTKNLNLKCINKICNCTANEYYSSKCLTKKTYMGSCHQSISMCKDGIGLSCLDGFCKCVITDYWNGASCVRRRNYTETCVGDQCLTTLMLDCNSRTKTCLCNSSRFWDGNVCAIKRAYTESCSSVIICNDNNKLTCISNICQCTSRQYYDPTFKVCLTSLYENSPCSSTYQCLTPMTCTVNKICQCGSFEYYDNATMTCKPQTSYSTPCLVTFNCRNDKGLTCQSGVCLCNPSIPDWITASSKCVRLLTYGETGCTATSDCKTGLNLRCITSLTNNCTCPTPTKISMCDCQRSNNNEFYWNGASCVAALAYGQPCTAGLDYMCRTITEGTICNGTCSCPTDSYFNSNSNCQQCPANWYFSNDICFQIFNTTSALCWNDAQTACSANGRLLTSTSILTTVTSLLDGQNYWVGARGFPNSGTNGCSNGGCPIKWISNGCASCSGNGFNGFAICTTGCSAYNCPSCSCNDCRCGGTISSLTWCGGSNPSSANCLLYDGTNNCYKDSSCTNTNYYICENP